MIEIDSYRATERDELIIQIRVSGDMWSPKEQRSLPQFTSEVLEAVKKLILVEL